MLTCRRAVCFTHTSTQYSCWQYVMTPICQDRDFYGEKKGCIGNFLRKLKKHREKNKNDKIYMQKLFNSITELYFENIKMKTNKKNWTLI